MKMLQSQAGNDKSFVEAVAAICGSDINVTICGGTHSHVGAVALGIPRQSLADPNEPSASVSVLCVTGHKEDDLVRRIAHKFASEFGCRVSVTAGIHIDGASGEQIAQLLANCDAVINDIEKEVKALFQS